MEGPMEPRRGRRGVRGSGRWSSVALVLTLGGCAPSSDAPSSANARPNILLIVADDLGYADLGAYGSDIRTPNIDALAAEGMLLTQFHSAPSCAPARSMLLTGNNNHVAGMGAQNQFVEGVPGYENTLSTRVAPLPRLLAEAGYFTVTVGKWHLGNAPGEAPPSAGFERSWSMINGAGSHFSGIGFSEGGSTYRENGVDVAWPEGAYSTEWYTDRLLGYLDEARQDGRPFFAYAAYTSPHWPLQVPDAWLDRYAGRYDEGYDVWRERNFENLKAAGIIPASSQLPPRNDAIRPWNELTQEERRVEARKMELYAAMVDNLDHHVGRLIDWLKEAGQYENTLVVFMSDNGASYEDFYERLAYVREHYDNPYEKMGRAGTWVSYGAPWGEAGSAPFSRYKTYTREGGMVAPFIVRGPGVPARGTIEDTYVTVMDVTPTLLEIAGGTYPVDGSVRPMEGESMSAFLSGAADRVHDDTYTTTLFHAGRAFVRRGRWKLVTLEPPFDEARFELFDVVADPGETRELSGSEPGIYTEMLELWRSERTRLGIILPAEFEAARR